MKNLKVLFLSLLAIGTMSCKPEEQKRVEEVVAPYSGKRTCTTTNLVGQPSPSTADSTLTIYVTKPKDFENGFISVLSQKTYLSDKLEFTVSTSNYYLAGKFEGPALTMTEDRVDQDAQQRIQCTYTLSKQ